ncbi:hypothetical protein SJA_C1-29500 [Sphingobium indicum UT26S]|uniref:Uncharacterized protein n=1 Tax=Sphingobium indicum (strain DSM 16413 / CCM 7287 / MTCC 6362 / UT26 / NBRC 101211 / UT26S) TaxID=452662 RepID=D4Z5A2_SPHIU|nr:hypothetical protein SJA_C1-29500 [Sphingobium indicum UT26S]
MADVLAGFRKICGAGLRCLLHIARQTAASVQLVDYGMARPFSLTSDMMSVLKRKGTDRCLYIF